MAARDTWCDVAWVRRGVGTLALLVVWGLLSGTAPLFGQAAEAGPPVEYGKEDHGLRINLAVVGENWTPGSKVEFYCTMENVSEKPIRVPLWGLEMNPVLEITEPDGGVRKGEAGRDATAAMPKDAFVVIAPKESRTFALRGEITRDKKLILHERRGGVWTWPLEDGEYGVRAVFSVGPDDQVAKEAKENVWTGRAWSNTVLVTVTEAHGKPVRGLRLALSALETELLRVPLRSRRVDSPGLTFFTEPTRLTLGFTNVSDRPIRISVYHLLHHHIRLHIMGPDRRSVYMVPIDFKPPVRKPVAEDYVTIKPGDTWTPAYHPRMPGLFGQLTYYFLKPGEYRLRAVYINRHTHVGDNPLTRGTWEGAVTSNELVLKVVETRQ